MKKNYTAEENAKRREVFACVRKYYQRTETYYVIKYRTETYYYKTFGRSKLVIEALDEAKERVSRNQTMMSERDRFLNKLRNNARNLSRCLPASGYSMGEERRVFNRKFGIYGRFDCMREYAKSCQWRPKYGQVDLHMPVMLIARLKNMEGVMTLKGKKVQEGIYKCQWIVFDYTRNGRGIINSEINYHLQCGYVVRREETYHVDAGWYHTVSLKEARENLRRFNDNHKKFLKAEAKQKKEEEKRVKDFQKDVNRVKRSKEMKDAIAHMYVYQDSIKAGNCVPGTNQFLKSNNLQKTDTRSGAFLLRISRNSGQYNNVVRVIENYLRTTAPDFFEANRKAISAVFND